MSDTQIIFDGMNGIASDTLIRITRRQSLAEGKGTDDEWIALFAASCFAGQALAWYESRSEEMQQSWRLLRRALLVRWPPPTVADSSLPNETRATPSNIPTPAGAAPLTLPSPPPPPPTASGLSASNNITANIAPQSTGVIRLLRESGDPFGYISNITNSAGNYQATQTRSEAVVVRPDRVELAHKFVLNASPYGECLGMSLPTGRARIQQACETKQLWWTELDTLRRDLSHASQWAVNSATRHLSGTASMWATLMNGVITPVWSTKDED